MEKGEIKNSMCLLCAQCFRMRKSGIAIRHESLAIFQLAKNRDRLFSAS
jgi:hypothetical protein